MVSDSLSASPTSAETSSPTASTSNAGEYSSPAGVSDEPGDVVACSRNPNGTLTIHGYDSSSGKLVRNNTVDPSEIHFKQFKQLGQIYWSEMIGGGLCSGQDWDMRFGKLLGTIDLKNGHENYVAALILSGDQVGPIVYTNPAYAGDGQVVSAAFGPEGVAYWAVARKAAPHSLSVYSGDGKTAAEITFSDGVDTTMNVVRMAVGAAGHWRVYAANSLTQADEWVTDSGVRSSTPPEIPGPTSWPIVVSMSEIADSFGDAPVSDGCTSPDGHLIGYIGPASANTGDVNHLMQIDRRAKSVKQLSSIADGEGGSIVYFNPGH